MIGTTTASPSPWRRWHHGFETRARRALPPLDGAADAVPRAVAAPLLESLRRFQLGEAGEGRTAARLARSELTCIDDDYRAALRLFVREEGRHACILKGLVLALGGRPLRHHWSVSVFNAARGAATPALDYALLLTAEVVGTTFYDAVAAALSDGTMRGALQQIAADEAHHLAFHRALVGRLFAGRPAARLAWSAAFIGIAATAASAMIWDHRATLRALGVGRRQVATRAAGHIATVAFLGAEKGSLTSRGRSGE